MKKSLVLFILCLFIPLVSMASTPRWWSVADVTELSRIKPGNTTESRKDGDLAFVESIGSTELNMYAIYRYSKTSTETDDDVNVVQPVSGPGRWILVVNGINYEIGDSLAYKVKRDDTLYFHYSFATDGGAVGNITLRGDKNIPNGSIIESCNLWVPTAFTSGGSATVTIQYNYTGTSWATILSSTAYDSAGTLGMHATTVSTASTTRYQIDKTGGATVRMVVGTAALTAGKATVSCKIMYQED